MRKIVMHMTGPAIIILLGMILTALGGFWPSMILEPDIIIFLGVILTALGGLWASFRLESEKVQSAQERAEFERELRKRSDEIASLNRDIAAYSKGEGSYCYFEPTVSSSQNAVIPALVNVGKYPLYDVRIRITPNHHKLIPPVGGKATYEILEEMMRIETHIDVGTLAPSNVPESAYPSLILKWDLPISEDKCAYNIFFSARNDHFTQYLRFWRVNGRWFVALKVLRQLGGEEGTVLKEFVQEGYPRNPDGSIDWDWTGN